MSEFLERYRGVDGIDDIPRNYEAALAATEDDEENE